MKQYVYVMKSKSGLVKVGVSKDPNTRRANLENSGGIPVPIVKTFGPYNLAKKVEMAAHRLLSEHRKAGEWFGCHENDAIRSINAVLSGFADLTDEECAKQDAKESQMAQDFFQKFALGPTRPDGVLADMFALCEKYADDLRALRDEHAEACELLDWYGENLQQTLFIADKAMKKIISLEDQIKKLQQMQPSILPN